MFYKLLSDIYIRKRYVTAGAIWGDNESYKGAALYLNADMVDFHIVLNENLKSLEKWERRCAERRYRTIPLEYFIGYGGGTIKSIEHLFDIQRSVDEEIILYAQMHRYVVCLQKRE